MNDSIRYYDVFPMVLRAGGESVVRIRPRFTHAKFPAEADKIKVTAIPLEGRGRDGSYRAEDNDVLLGWELEKDGTLAVRIFCSSEQEYNITLELTEPFCRESCEWALVPHAKLRFNVYAVADDLYELRPFRGDIHLHTNLSDGREAPEYVAARYREIGMDFIAITDHYRHATSVETIEYWSKLPIDLRLFPGEEVHTPENPVHIVNFGGSYSVHAWARNNREQYKKEVEQYMTKLPELPAGQDPFQVAATELVFDKIRESGGLALYCHPDWQMDRYMISEAVAATVLARRKFDAFELVSGYYPCDWKSNNLQLMRYFEEAMRGGTFPVVGVSDAHHVDGDENDRLAGWFWTIVFAKSDSLTDLQQAIRAQQCVAVEKVNDGEPHVIGPMRIMRYAGYLLENYFPRHDELCRLEGRLMIEYVAGSEGAEAALKALQGQVAQLRERMYCQPQ